MLDFGRVEFSKAISLNPVKLNEANNPVSNPFANSKYELVRLGEICEILIGGTPSRNNPSYFQGNNLWVSIAEMRGQIIIDTKEKITDEAIEKSNVKLIPKGTTLLSFKLSIGKTAIAGKDLYT
ncbi:MAG: restriction endonuclease subunit S, partial [Helicobacter sp.]|nr:restriction endonuclease subunit S [Helicobacter sp.]